MADEEIPDDESNEEPAAEPEAPAALSPTASQPSPTLASVAAGANQPMAPGTSPMAQPPPLNQTVMEYLQAQQAKMAEAQAQASQNEKYSGLARAGAQLAAGLAGSNQAVNQQPFDALDQEAKAPVTNLMEKQKAAAGDIALKTKLDEEKQSQEENDPDSEASQRFRQTLKAQFPSIAAAYGDDFDDITAADSKDILKVAETKAKLEEQKQVAGLRGDAAKAARDARAQQVEDKRTEAQKAQDNKDAIELDNYLSKGWTSRSSQAAGVQGNLNQIERLEGLIEQGKKQEGGMTGAQLEELAVGTSKLLGGGAGSDARVNGLLPHTFMGNVQDAVSWAKNEPRGRDQQAFTDQVADLIAREKEIAEKQKQRFQLEGLPARQRLRQSNPALFENVIGSKGIDPSMLDENGRAKQASTQPPADQNDVHARAAALLAQRQAAKAQAAQQQPQPSQTPTPDGMAYGGMVGGLPSSNYAAAMAMRPPRPPHLNLHNPRGYADGGEVKKPDNSTWVKNSNESYRGSDPKADAKVYTGYTQGGAIPGRAPVHGDSPKNDTVPIMASPGEYVVPRHVMQGPAGRLIRKLCEGGTV